LQQLAFERNQNDDYGPEQQQNDKRRSLGPSTLDVCLINCMEWSEKLKPLVLVADDPQQQPQPQPQQQRTAVSWHADSSLEHFSTIAVYQTLLPIANGHDHLHQVIIIVIIIEE
jgi:hypothetical protein